MRACRLDRRGLLVSFSLMKAALLALVLMTASAFAVPLQDISFQTMDGKESSLKDYSGQVVLVVNVASKCGLTKQYAALEALYKKFGPQGFVILGFPCNDFNGQEPGTNEEIQKFCTEKFNVTFPLFDKISVKGDNQAPLYQALTGPDAKFPGDVKWNFGKFLIGKDGEVIARFEPRTTPDDPAVVSAVEAALK
jgi:glutathione peroxidase